MLISTSGLFGCGKEFDIESEADRLALKSEIRKSLTQGNCEAAIDLTNQIYNTKYTDNDFRFLHANAHACRIGINFFDIADGLAGGDLSATGFWETVVSLFPSRTDLDTKFQSASYAQDAIHAIWSPTAVVSAPDSYYRSSFNPATVWYRDRPNEANTLLFFVSLGNIGTVLNRYGYTAVQEPIDYNYQQKVVLPWLIYILGVPDVPNSLTLVKADTTGSACGLASGVLNLLDGMNAMKSFASGTVAQSINTILANIESPLITAAHTSCRLLVGSTDQQCDDARRRLRFRSACGEDDLIAMSATGLIFSIDQTWTDAP